MFALVALIALCACSALPSPPMGTLAAAHGALTRTLGRDSTLHFSITLDAASMAATLSAGVPLSVRAPNAVDAVAVCAHYLRSTLNASFAWPGAGGLQVSNLPPPGSPLPAPAGGPITLRRAVPYTYYMNVVQNSYSNVWWDAARWQAEVDWMMVHGVNIALAYGGQEALWRQAYESFGVTAAQLDEFFNGPAYLSWSRGQGQAGVGGPLPSFWFEQQLALNKGLVAAMVAAGIVPVLPAFQGNVPLAMRQLFPAANISSLGWLDVFDPLFDKIADAYMPLLRAAYDYPNGTLFYEADGLFSSGTPPWAGPQREGGGSHGGPPPPLPGAPPPPPDPAAAARSAAAFTSFARHDDGAVWVYQSWIWRGFSSAKDWAYGRGWVTGAPPGRLLFLDQTAERVPIWSLFGNWSFDGQPFAWLSMNNMGGNEGLVGALEWVRDGIAAARAGSGGALAAVGLDPEGINTMPAYWLYVLDRTWEATGGAAGREDPADALGDFGVRRCGREGAALRGAWEALGATVFSPSTQSNTEHHLKYCGTALPLASAGNGWNAPMKRPGFAAAALAAAWKGLLEAAPGCAPAAAFDLVDVVREYLTSFPCVAAHDALLAAKDVPALEAAMGALRGVLTDLDAVLGSMRGFLFGEWLADAEAVGAAGGASGEELALLAWNARAQVTTWFPSPPSPDNHLYDYANKMWSGLAKDYYLQRYELLAVRLRQAIAAGKPGNVDPSVYAADLTKLGLNWTLGVSAKSYPEGPVGDPIAIAAALFSKYVKA